MEPALRLIQGDPLLATPLPFIVHDWLFHMKNCKLPGYEKYSVEEAATIMSEVMKTMMEAPDFNYGSKTTVYLMYEAVQTQPARDAWNDGPCVTPEVGLLEVKPDEVFVVEFRSRVRNPRNRP